MAVLDKSTSCCLQRLEERAIQRASTIREGVEARRKFESIEAELKHVKEEAAEEVRRVKQEAADQLAKAKQ